MISILAVLWAMNLPPASAYQSYSESRAEFRLNCRYLKIDCSTWTVPSAADPDLTVDYGFHRVPSSTRLLIVVCGTHGAEAPTGCHLINQMLKTWLKRMSNRGISLLAIHAANPFGYKFNRRTTENNVDLNRSFLEGDRPQNEGYEKLKINLEPQNQAGHPTFGFLDLSARMIWRLVTRDFSMIEMRQAVASGQYTSPKGLFFGGEKPEPQLEFYRELFPRTFSGFQEILLIDIHTGLGKRGVMHLIPTDSLSESGQTLLNRVFPNTEESKKYFELTPSSTSGFYKTFGSFNDFAQQSAATDQTLVALTMEFGTLGSDVLNQLRSLSRMTIENQGTHFGYNSDANKKRAEFEFRELFTPSSPEWRTEIERKAIEVFSLINKNL